MDRDILHFLRANVAWPENRARNRLVKWQPDRIRHHVR